MLMHKQFWNRSAKKSPSVELTEPFFEKVDWKSVDLAKTFLTKEIENIKSSHFPYGTFTKSALEIVDKILAKNCEYG